MAKRRPLPKIETPADLAEVYRRCFSTEAGEQVLADLRKRFGRRRSFDQNPYQAAFNEGQRDVYLLVMNQLDAELNDPEEA